MRQPGAGGQAALPAHLKEINRQKILRVILSGRVLTVGDIHAETSISRPTVMRALQDYMRMGVVRSLGPGSTTSAGSRAMSTSRMMVRVVTGLWAWGELEIVSS